VPDAPAWHDREFAELTTAELYAIVMLRERVFVVEQHCAYLDADGYDPRARHLWGERAGELVAYLRVLPAGEKYAEIAIGRVITAPEARGTGIGRELMRRGLALIGSAAVRISAQAHLQRFYGEFGFRPVSEIYQEDGIPHLEMLRPDQLANG
jgi:ElaA protein